MTKEQSTKIKTTEIEGITLEINPDNNELVPTHQKNFINHAKILEKLALGVKNNMPVLLLGESGNGKTAALNYLAKITNNPLRRINLSGGTTEDMLLGRNMLNKDGTYWVDGPLTEAVRKGYWIAIDEINAALPEVHFILHSLMDDDGALTLLETDKKEVVKKHPNCRIFATMNDSSYEGTKTLNQALLSRFSICINVEYPKKDAEINIIKEHLGEEIALGDLTKVLIDIATETREEKIAGKRMSAINTRDIINILKLSEDLETFDAFCLGYANKTEGEEKKALITTTALSLPQKKLKKGQTKEITEKSEIRIGKTYTIKEDKQEAYININEEADLQKLLSASIAIETSSNKFKKATKGEEITIKGVYYKKDSAGRATEVGDRGEAFGFLVQFKKGKNEGKIAMLPTMKEYKDTESNVTNLLEIGG